MLVLVLAVRFFLELALFAGAALAAASLASHTAGKVALGTLAVVIVIGAWSTLLSPKRPTDLRLRARVLIELMLFLAVGAGLWVAGFAWAGVAIVALDALVLVALFALGDEPGRHFDPRQEPSA